MVERSMDRAIGPDQHRFRRISVSELRAYLAPRPPTVIRLERDGSRAPQGRTEMPEQAGVSVTTR